MRMRITGTIIIMVVCVAVRAADVPSGSFGEGVGGISIALLAKGDVAGQPVIVVRNENPTALKVQGAFAWLLLAESRDVAFYSDKMPLDVGGQEIAPASELRYAIPVAQLQARAYQKGIKVIDGYPQATAEQGIGAGAAGRAVTNLLAAPLKAQAVAFVPAGGLRITVRSKAATLSIARIASTQSDDVAALVERFRHDAFAARDAADVAAAKGAGVIPALVQGLNDPTMPDFGQMWIATALTRIGGDQAAKAVIPLVDDPREGVRDVIAFHGPTMKQQGVDDAIMARAKSDRDPVFTAWAARGFAEHGRPIPQGLVLAALASSEPRARAEVAEVLAISADPVDAGRLAKLFSDDNELVRVAAADAVARHPKQAQPIIAAMVSALDHPGESARVRIVAALAKVAGRDWQYVADGPTEPNNTLLQQIRIWGGSRK